MPSPPPSSTPTPSSSPIQTLPPWNSTSPTRLQSLYSDFSRQKTSNPASFQANVEWWRRALEEVVRTGFQDVDDSTSGKRGSRLVLHANAGLLERVKVPRVGKPLALGAVLSDLQTTSHSIYPLPTFLSLTTSIYATASLPLRIASYVVGKPLWWALEQMGITGEEGLLSSASSSSSSHGQRNGSHHGAGWHGDYVLLSLVSKAAAAVLERQRNNASGPADALYSFEGFRRTFGSVVHGTESGEENMDEQDAKVLLKYLERDRGVVVCDKDVVKFVQEDAPAEDRVITPVDRGILELKDAVANMHAQVDAVQARIDQCTSQAALALSKSHKQHALTYIRTRKHLATLLSQRLSSLHTLESTLITVESAATDAALMQTYANSTEALKTILSDPRMQRGNVEKTMEALEEAGREAKEVGDVIREGAGEEVDEEEVEREWEELVREMGGAEKGKEEKQGGERDKQREVLASEALKSPSGVPQGAEEREEEKAEPVPST